MNFRDPGIPDSFCPTMNATFTKSKMTKPKKTSIPPKPSGGYRVIHTADWHLGKMLGEQSRHEEQERFLAFLLETIAANAVDALVIAGDVFDSANPPQRAVAQYYTFLSKLVRIGDCRVIITSGNHDSPGHLEAPREILRALGAHVVGAMPENPADALIPLPDAQSPKLVVAALPFLRDRDLRTGMSGQSATEIEQALVEGIQKKYTEAAMAAKDYAEQGISVMATGHLTVIGSKVSESEREIHVGGLGKVGTKIFSDTFEYVALGHLHRPQMAGGKDHIRYAGSPIPLSFSEAEDRKSLLVLDFADGQLYGQAEIPIPLTRQLKQLTSTREGMEDLLKEFQPDAGDLPAWVELVIQDAVPGENLIEQARELILEKPFEIIRLISRQTVTTGSPDSEGREDEQDINDLLCDPLQVFERRLQEEINLTGEEREELQTAFGELYTLFQETEQAQ